MSSFNQSCGSYVAPLTKIILVTYNKVIAVSELSNSVTRAKEEDWGEF